MCYILHALYIYTGAYDSKEAMQSMIKDVEQFETKDDSEKANR
jgi:hypothetical protein